MKFVCLVYIDPAKIAAATPEELRQLTDDTIEEDWQMHRSGKLILSQPLDVPFRARTLRHDGSVTDGPFSEAKEHLGGFFIVDAKDMDEAIELSKGAIVKYGSIEVRPTMEQTHSETGQPRPDLKRP